MKIFSALLWALFVGIVVGTTIDDMTVFLASENSNYGLSLSPSAFYYLSFTSYGDVVAHMDPFISNELVTLKRNSEGFYDRISNVSLAELGIVVQSLDIISLNDNWLSIAVSPLHYMFPVNADGSISTDFQTIEVLSNRAKLFPDGTYVVAAVNSIYTFEFIENEWVQTREDAFEPPVDGQFFSAEAVPFTKFRENYIVAVTESGVHLFSRHANQSWTWTDIVPFDVATLGLAFNFVWNGDDSLIQFALLEPEVGASLGTVFIHTKVNGEWSVTQEFTASELGFAGIAYMGLEVHQLDNNNVLVAASLDDVVNTAELQSPTVQVGSVLLLHRDESGEWDFTTRIRSEELGIFGFGVRSNDFDIVVYQCKIIVSTVDCSLNTLPRCFNAPMNVTCNDVQLDDCSLELDFSPLYTVNNPQCGQPTASFSSASFENNAFLVDFTLSRAAAADVTCSVTLTCPAPPVAPVSVPVSVVPVAAPVTSNGIQLSISALVLIGSALLV